MKQEHAGSTASSDLWIEAVMPGKTAAQVPARMLCGSRSAGPAALLLLLSDRHLRDGLVSAAMA